MANWKKEIRTLCKDFGMGDKYREIVTKVEKDYKGKDENYLYDRAWSQFKTLLNTL